MQWSDTNPMTGLPSHEALEAASFRRRFEMMTEDELGVTLGVTRQTLATWRSESQGPSYTKLGKTVFYRFLDVMAWIELNVINIGPVKPQATTAK